MSGVARRLAALPVIPGLAGVQLPVFRHQQSTARPCSNSTRLSISSRTCARASSRLGGIFDYPHKHERLTEVELELADPKVWDNPERAQKLGRERAELERVVNVIDEVSDGIVGGEELLELAQAENDEDTLLICGEEGARLEKLVADLEFRRMFSGEADPNNCYLEIQSGAGGTEAQDWAGMLLRMYLRWAESHGFKTDVLELSDGEVAGVKSATVHIQGEYAYGWLRTETGVHRLVRKSPFDSGNRRHTSFCSVFISPEVDDSIAIEINPADLRVDTYRSSGAGGQHVNKTESAIRFTHLPTGVVVACQTERSQHANRDKAMKMLRAKLYELEMQKRNAAKQALEDSKSDIGWGSQIRSYVLDQSRVKDLRTNVETSNTGAVLDGGIDLFIEASLKSGL